jgi:hypothetical protein
MAPSIMFPFFASPRLRVHIFIPKIRLEPARPRCRIYSGLISSEPLINHFFLENHLFNTSKMKKRSQNRLDCRLALYGAMQRYKRLNRTAEWAV